MQILRVCEPDHTPPRVQDCPRFACDCGRREGLSTPGRRAVMSIDFMERQSKDGLTLMLYRGEDMVLMAFDIDESLRPRGVVAIDQHCRDVADLARFKSVAEEQGEKRRQNEEQKQHASVAINVEKLLVSNAANGVEGGRVHEIVVRERVPRPKPVNI